MRERPDLEIDAVDIWPIDVPMRDPFVISQGTVTVAENLIVRVTLAGGVAGFGEVAPFVALTGEDRAASAEVLAVMARSVLGRPVSRHRALAGRLAERWPTQAAARCGIETAAVDAYARAVGLPMWAVWGGADVRRRETDITIPIAEPARCLALARGWRERGFTTFKLKVGTTVEEDVRRVTLIDDALDSVAFVLDANQGFTEREAIAFARAVRARGCDVRAFEQPVAKTDLDGLAAVRHAVDVPVVADESVATAADAVAVIRAGAVDGINLKIMKSGLTEAADIATVARTSGLRLMIGGMVETRVAMGCSLALALGLGGIELLDLDTPLLLDDDPVDGGYRYDGPSIGPWPGTGLALVPRCATGPASRRVAR